jgi:hypothetical protein
MEERKVWEIVEAEEVPKDRKPIACKWVFKKKRCGLHRAQLVALKDTAKYLELILLKISHQLLTM